MPGAPRRDPRVIPLGFLTSPTPTDSSGTAQTAPTRFSIPARPDAPPRLRTWGGTRATGTNGFLRRRASSRRWPAAETESDQQTHEEEQRKENDAANERHEDVDGVLDEVTPPVHVLGPDGGHRAGAAREPAGWLVAEALRGDAQADAAPPVEVEEVLEALVLRGVVGPERCPLRFRLEDVRRVCRRRSHHRRQALAGRSQRLGGRLRCVRAGGGRIALGHWSQAHHGPPG